MVAISPYATDALPVFVVEPGKSDILMIVAFVFLVAVIFCVGVLYLRLHALPEQIAHRTNKIQMELVAVLALVALFTNEHFYWIAALVLAFIKFPNFISPVISIARSLKQVAAHTKKEGKHASAEIKPPEGAQPPAPVAPIAPAHVETKELGHV